MFYVYVLFRSNGEPFYIGKGSGSRIKLTLKQGKTNALKARAIRQTRRDLGEVPSVILHHDLDEITAFQYERVLIAAIGRYPHGPLTNLTDGGEGTSGITFTPERKAKIASALAGNKNAVGTVCSPETAAKHSAIKTGNQHAKGYRQSPEHVAKKRDALMAWMATPEGQRQIQASALARTGQKRSPETIAKIREARARQTARDAERKGQSMETY